MRKIDGPRTSSDVPPGLWIKILGLLDPPDIMSLSETCKDLQNLTTSERDVWIDALRAMCLKRGLFAPTYPIDGMDLKHLQRAAMAPFIWGNRIHGLPHAPFEDGYSSLWPVSTTHIDLTSPGDGRDHYLVPGGRFLITAGDDILKVWDLGIPGIPQPATPTLITESGSLGLDDDESLSSFDVGVVDDGWLRIVVLSSGDRVSVWEICLNDDRPTLRALPGSIRPAHLPDHQYGWSAHLHDGRILMYTIDHTLIIWDYIKNRYTLWSIEISMQEWYDVYMLFVGDFLLLFFPNVVKVWRVPCPDRPITVPTTETAIHSPTDVTPSPPDATILFPFELPSDCFPLYILPSDHWHPRTQTPLFFHALYLSTDVDRVIESAALHQLDLTDLSDSAGLTAITGDLKLVKRLRFPSTYKYKLGGVAPNLFDLANCSSIPLAFENHPVGPRAFIPSIDIQSLGIPEFNEKYFSVYSSVRKPPGGHNDQLDENECASNVVKLVTLDSHSTRKIQNKWSLCSSSGRLVYTTYPTATRSATSVVINYVS